MNARVRLGLALLIVASAMTSARAAAPAQGGVARAVAAVLAGSASAWNRGDLDAFMSAYEDSPRTVYVGSKAVVHGYAAIRAHYARTYRPGRMGTLSVSDLDVRPLGANYALAVARWHLADKGTTAGGLFTLVLHRNGGGWHIITDHTP